MNLICFGSSITESAGFPEGERWPTILQFRLEQWKPGAWKVFNRGIGGHTTTDLLDRFETDVAPLLPGVVLLQVGGNDSAVRPWCGLHRVSVDEFLRNLHGIHDAVSARGGRTVFMTYHRFRLTETIDYKPYASATRAVARSCGAPIIDLYRMMVERETEVSTFVVEDGLHLTALGNVLYAEMVFEGLQEILPGPPDT